MDVTTELQGKITMDTSDAQDNLSSFGDSLSNVGSIVSGIIVSDILVNLYNQIVQIGEGAIDSAANLQNIGVAAEYAFGSGSGAQSMLNTLNQISATTPFTNEQLDNLAIRMQNMGVPTQQITSNLQDLSNIASATGTDVQTMSQVLSTSADDLSLAYQRGSISSIYLRGIANQGIPIYQALVDVINKSGSASAESASAIADNAKKLSDAQTQQITLTQQLSDAQQKLNNLQEKAPNTQATIDAYNLSLTTAQQSVQKLATEVNLNQQAQGSAAYEQLVQQLDNAQQKLQNIQETAPNTTASMDAYSLSVQQAQNSLSDLNTKLADNQTLIAQLSTPSGLITTSDLLNNTKNITITAQQLQEAFAEIGEGKDLGAASAQAQTYTGTLKNLNQQFQETYDGIIGVSQAGVVQRGGLFDQLTQSAQAFLSVLNQNQSSIVAFGQLLIKTFEEGLAPAIQASFGFLEQHQAAVVQFLQQFTLDLAEIAGLLIGKVVPAVLQFINYIINNRGDIVAWLDNVGTALSSIATFVNDIVAGFRALSSLPAAAANALHIPGFAEGVTNFPGGLALVGEKGPELVNLPSGADVTPNNQMPAMGTTIHIHNPVVRSQNDITALVNQVKQALGRQNELARLGAI